MPTPDDLAITFVDWNPLPPDKDMGLYREVYVTASGPVAVRHAQVITRFDLPSLSVAHLTVAADLINATGRTAQGTLRARIGHVSLSETVRLEPHEKNGLSKLPRVSLEISAQAQTSGASAKEEVTLQNPTRHLAFFVHLRVLKGAGGEDVHPILWQDNYFELMPGEKRTVAARYSRSELGGRKPVVAIDGWNVTPATAE